MSLSLVVELLGHICVEIFSTLLPRIEFSDKKICLEPKIEGPCHVPVNDREYDLEMIGSTEVRQNI